MKSWRFQRPLCPNRVRHYKYLLLKGAGPFFPPILILGNLLVNGQHRLAAARSLNLPIPILRIPIPKAVENFLAGETGEQ